MILTNTQSVNESKIDLDASEIEVVYGNDWVMGGSTVVMKNGDRYFVRENFDQVERMRQDDTTSKL